MQTARTVLTLATCIMVAAGCAADRGEADAAAAADTIGQTTPAGDSTAGDTVAVEPALECAGLELSLLRAEPGRAGLRQTHGEPDSVRATTEPNRHMAGAIDSLFDVFYPGLRASFRTPPSARDLITAVSITDNRYISDARIGIGAREDTVIALLGPPTRREGGALVYDCGEVEQPVRFELSSGRVTAIAIAYYVD